MSDEPGTEMVQLEVDVDVDAAGERAALVPELEEDERLLRRPARKVTGKVMSPAQREAAKRSRTSAALRRAAGRGVRPPVRAKTATQLARESLSESTMRAYRSGLRQFGRWLAGFKEHEPHDPEDLARIKTAPSLIADWDTNITYINGACTAVLVRERGRCERDSRGQGTGVGAGAAKGRAGLRQGGL